MVNINTIKKEITQITALIEKNIQLRLRFKYELIISYITPFIGIVIPLIIMGQIFEYNTQFGPWTKNNFIIYQLLAYNIFLLQDIIYLFPTRFREEKFWQTLPALIIAPSNRINLLLGIFFAHLSLILIPLTIIFIFCFIMYPITFFTILFVIVLFLLISLLFSGIGLLLGIFSISKENAVPVLRFMIRLFFITSCISFPFELFPESIQKFINLNPFYHIFFILRIAWIENNTIISINLHLISFIILIGFAIAVPSVGVYTFNKVYKKYGIVGY